MTIDNEHADFDLPLELLRAGAVRLSPDEPFTWASGIRAPIYCDNRQLLGFPDIRATLADALAAASAAEAPSLIAGTSTAGIPWAAMVADRLGLPLAYVRPEPKKHGMGRQVEGPSGKGHSVVLVEDLISTGGSSLKCVEALRQEGADVLCVLALFSYELPGAGRAFEASGARWRTLAGFTELIACAVREGLVTGKGAEALEKFRVSSF
jgi:orotate phosphoribosyltransferase